MGTLLDNNPSDVVGEMHYYLSQSGGYGSVECTNYLHPLIISALRS